MVCLLKMTPNMPGEKSCKDKLALAVVILSQPIQRCRIDAEHNIQKEKEPFEEETLKLKTEIKRMKIEKGEVIIQLLLEQNKVQSMTEELKLLKAKLTECEAKLAKSEDEHLDESCVVKEARLRPVKMRRANGETVYSHKMVKPC